MRLGGTCAAQAEAEGAPLLGGAAEAGESETVAWLFGQSAVVYPDDQMRSHLLRTHFSEEPLDPLILQARVSLNPGPSTLRPQPCALNSVHIHQPRAWSRDCWSTHHPVSQ